MSEFDKSVDELFDTAARWSKGIVVASVVLSLGVLSVVLWAIISLVLHFT